MTQDDPSPQPDRAARADAPARRLRDLAVGGALVAVVVAVTTWLLTPGSLAQRLPGDEALGTAALFSYSAARDHDIRDEDATREQRQAAAAAERPVYDRDEGALEDATQRVRASFGLLRDALAAGSGRRPDPRHRDPQREAREARALAAAQREAFEERLGVAIGDEDFAALADARFAQGMEDALAALVARGLSGDVVEDLRSVTGERGIAVRSVSRGVPTAEHVLTDLDQLRSVHAVRDDLVRAAGGLLGFGPAQRLAMGHLAAALSRPTLVFDLAETARRQQDASDRVKPVVVHVRRGEKVIADGEIIDRHHLLVFRGIREQTRTADVLRVRCGAAVLLALLLVLLWRHLRQNVPTFRPSPKDAVLLAAAILASAGLAAAGLAAGDALHDRFPHFSPEFFFYLVPFAAGALVIRSVLPAGVALAFAIASGVLVGLVAGNSILIGLHAMLTSVLASGLVLRTRDRRGLFQIGAKVGAVGALLVAATHLFSGRGGLETAAPALAALVAGAVLLPVLTMLTLPVVQRGFGYLTDLRLLELANLNHPALKDLIIQAPGTYHHAVIMGGLAEAAARAVGANPLLARVGAYYHDVGKIRNPIYFAENQRTENRHDALAPSMSALIVKRHVTDGVEVARHWGLPREVVDIIRQHHGTRLVSFFWARAKARAESAGEEVLEEAVFRYPGPKPQTREAALVMIADACEASARGIPEATPERLQELVHRRINEIFGEGQLDDCELTLKDLQAIAAALATGLEAILAARPERGEPGPATGAPSAPAVTPLQLVATERRRP